jgi:hypothetical protein
VNVSLDEHTVGPKDMAAQKSNFRSLLRSLAHWFHYATKVEGTNRAAASQERGKCTIAPWRQDYDIYKAEHRPSRYENDSQGDNDAPHPPLSELHTNCPIRNLELFLSHYYGRAAKGFEI